MCDKGIGWIMAQACITTPMIGNGLLPEPASSGRRAHPPRTLSTDVPVALPGLFNEITVMGLLEQNTLGYIQDAGKAQLQEFFRTTPTK